MSEQISSAISAALKESPICNQIVKFLIDNETAMDTVKGVAAWWLGCDEIAAQAALDQLMACGVVTVRTRISGPLYGFTADPDLRSSLRTLLGSESSQSSHGDRSLLRDETHLAGDITSEATHCLATRPI